MKIGRPPSWNPIASLGRSVWTDVLPLASKGRVVFPVPVRAHLAWLADAGNGLLAVIEPGRSAEVLPWRPNGETAIAHVKRAINEADEREKDELALAAMDRFIRLSVDPAGRATLPSPLASHLDAEIATCVRLVMRGARLWLWSERRWQAQRVGRIRLLAEHSASGTPILGSASSDPIR